ncbi:Ig-like domain-containing protein, partial [Shewanella sp. MMG014]|uniref:Ig-like domain-containing protein n=1 Tax=Shewanella sp. MMG014 TaxID=2822691 RepID=UPI001B39377A
MSFVAVGYYSDGTSSQLNDLSLSNWRSDEESVGFFGEPGIFYAASEGAVVVSVIVNGVESNDVNISVTDPVITAITVTPGRVDVAMGQEQQLTATATYSDDTSSDVSDSVTWFSLDTSIASVLPSGLLIAGDVGATVLTATKDGVGSNEVVVTVTDAIVTGITVTSGKVASASVNVAVGQTVQLKATANYSDGTSSDVSGSVLWLSNDFVVSPVTPTGLVAGNKIGLSKIVAHKGHISSNEVGVTVTDAFITAITVTPVKVDVAKGQTEQLIATAIYSDFTSSDVSDSVTWLVDDANTATVAPSGLLTGNEVGATFLTAQKDGVTSNTANVDITGAVITALTVTPAQVDIAKGQTEQLTVMATYSDSTSSDVTSSVAWLVDDTNTATVAPSGLL